MALDFSKLDKLAYRGFEDAARAEEKDALVEQGFTILEGVKTPFDTPQEPSADKPTPAPQQPSKRQTKPLAGLDGTDYRKCYRIAFNFQEKYTPPRDTEEYRQSAADEYTAIVESNRDNVFLIALLQTVYLELARQDGLLLAQKPF